MTTKSAIFLASTLIAVSIPAQAQLLNSETRTLFPMVQVPGDSSSMGLNIAPLLGRTDNHMGAGNYTGIVFNEPVDSNYVLNPNWYGTYTGSFSGFSPAYSGVSQSFAASGTMNFSGMVNGYLPAGTVIMFHDTDKGSVIDEYISLLAYSNGDLIVTPWLSAYHTLLVSGGTSIDASYFPDYVWDADLGTYTFHGDGVVPNPTFNYYAVTTVDIDLLSFDRSAHNNFQLAAPTLPIPEPSSVLLVAVIGAIGVMRRARNS